MASPQRRPDTDYAPYLKHNLKAQKSLSFDKTMEIILKMDNSQWAHGTPLQAQFAQVTMDRELRKRLKDLEVARDEEELYELFNHLSNCILDLLKEEEADSSGGSIDANEKEDDIQVSINRPTRMLGSHALRSPDLIICQRHVLNRGSYDGVAITETKKKCHHWVELLSFIEFKHTKKEEKPKEVDSSLNPMVITPALAPPTSNHKGRLAQSSHIALHH